MPRAHARPLRVLPLCTLVALVLLLVGGAAPGALGAATKKSALATSTAATAGSLTFGPTTVVDDQRAAGEPDVKICGPSSTWSYGSCGQDNPYSSAPWGFSTTTSYIWRSEDRARTFKLVPSNDTTGKPDACPGGGDTDLAVSPGTTQATDFLDFIDLQALTNFSDGVSADGGQVWACNAASSFATAVDRQWFGVYKNPAGAYLHPVGGNGSIVYLDYDIAAGSSACLSDPQANGNAFIVQKSIDGGLTYGPPSIVDCNDGIAGNIQVNQTTGHVFALHTAYSSPTQSNSDQITVNRSTDFGSTWQRIHIFDCGGTCTVAQDFAVLAIDKAGNLYAVWSQAPIDASGNITGPSHIFYSYSSDDGVSWSPEQQVDHGATDVNLFPWVAAGNSGAIDVVWYGTTKASSVSSYDPGKQVTDWFPYLAQSLHANTSAAGFGSPVAVSQHPNHNGGICTMGIGCTTGGDRSLADFFQVDVNKQGGADVVWADTSNNGSSGDNQGALIDEARQIGGTTLFGTTLSGSLTLCRAVTRTPCQSDPTGDAKYEANGVVGPNAPKLDITGSSLNIDPINTSRLDARMQIANLSALPGAGDGILGGPVVDYLTSWNYHIPGNTQANFDSTGNIYYAYLEVNTATGAVTAFDGNTCSIATTHPKYLVYPGQNAIPFRIDRESGTVDLYVPRGDVGNPPLGATLYSVTAHTVSQPAQAGPFNCSSRDPNGNNQDPTGQIFNVYDKSPAYTSLLTTPTGTSNGCGQTPDTTQAESDFVSEVNQHRASLGLPALTLNSTLANEAREHSCDMAEHNDLSETGSDGSTPAERITAAGLSFIRSGENIGMASSPLPLQAVPTIDSQIFANPLYQANILDPAFTQLGVGVVYVNGQEWVTEDFVD
ncbi:MAG TPA: CAP domain-containing protein [Gaiellaceae bacterium]